MIAVALRSIDGIVSGSLSAATPILLAALGGMYTYYAGIFNIAMEGMMLSGAFGAVAGAFYGRSWVFGVAGAVGASLVLTAVFALFVIVLRTDEFITGIALNLAAVGATTFLLRRVFHVAGAFSGTGTKRIPAIPRVTLHFVDRVPIVRALLNGHTLVEWFAVVAVVASAGLVSRTRFGLRLRSAGYSPASLDASGVSTRRVRLIALLLCGILCGLAGAFLSIGYLQLFGENMSNGRGWIALAAIIVVRGRPMPIAVMAVLFGFATSLGLRAQSLSVPNQFTEMLPYLATLVALYVYGRRRTRSSSVRHRNGRQTAVYHLKDSG